MTFTCTVPRASVIEVVCLIGIAPVRNLKCCLAVNTRHAAECGQAIVGCGAFDAVPLSGLIPKEKGCRRNEKSISIRGAINCAR